MKKRQDEKLQKIAKERIELLFAKAEQVFPKNTERANRYIGIARRIAMKTNLRLTKAQKRSFCKHCYKYIVSGINAKIRIRNKKIITYCNSCKKYTRISLRSKTKSIIRV